MQASSPAGFSTLSDARRTRAALEESSQVKSHGLRVQPGKLMQMFGESLSVFAGRPSPRLQRGGYRCGPFARGGSLRQTRVASNGRAEQFDAGIWSKNSRCGFLRGER